MELDLEKMGQVLDKEPVDFVLFVSENEVCGWFW